MEVGICTESPQEPRGDTGAGGGHRELPLEKLWTGGEALVGSVGGESAGALLLHAAPSPNSALDCIHRHHLQVQSRGIRIGPRMDLRTQLEMDKDDESLMRWKRNLLGQAAEIADQSVLEPEVEVLSFKVLVNGRPEILIPLARNGMKVPNFVLKEKSIYRVQFEFLIRKNIVLGLTYINDVFRHGKPVEETEEMMGTYAPQETAYVFSSEEETTPSGWFAKGHYSARCKFVDDDGRCYADFSYTFDIRKDWD